MERRVKKRKKVVVSASFLDPVLKAQIRPSVEREVKFKYLLYRLKDYCFGNGKQRGSFQAWLNISNGYMRPVEGKKERVTRSFSRLPKMQRVSRSGSRPMFILISEKEVNAGLSSYCR